MGEGDENSPFDWLPAGWRTEVKARKSGRKDRYYIDPSNALRFPSKPEVLRYLKKAENNHPLCEESKKESSTDDSPVKFVDKEAVSEDLPEGWIKKFRVTRSGNQKDPYYIDPVSGHQFRSLKEVFLYLDSKKTDSKNNGRHASKTEEKTPLKSGAADHAIPSTAERRQLRSNSNRKVQKLIPENQNPEIEALVINNLGLTSKLNKLKPCKEKAISSEICSPVPPNFAEKIVTEKQEDMPVEKMQTDKTVELQEDIMPEKKQRVDAQDDILSEKIQIDKRVEVQEDTLSEEMQKDKILEKQEDIPTSGMKKKKRIKRETELPRRTSKRLAGVEVQLPVVLELPTRVRQATITPTSEDQTRCSSNIKGSDNSVEQDKRMKTGDETCKLEGKEHASHAVVDALPEEKHPEQGVAVVLLKEQTEQKVADVLPEMHVKQGHEETEMTLDSSLGGLWNDPCIEFAIKTLTSDFPVGNDKKVDAAGPSSCQDLPLGDLWSDPCFEFAVKTLTGDIPPIDATHFQQQHWPSKTGESNGIRLPNYKAAEFNQTNGAYR